MGGVSAGAYNPTSKGSDFRRQVRNGGKAPSIRPLLATVLIT